MYQFYSITCGLVLLEGCSMKNELDTIEKAVAVMDDEVDIVSFGLQVVTAQGLGHNP